MAVLMPWLSDMNIGFKEATPGKVIPERLLGSVVCNVLIEVVR
jgi:hypothetical protein